MPTFANTTFETTRRITADLTVPEPIRPGTRLVAALSRQPPTTSHPRASPLWQPAAPVKGTP